MSTGVLIPSTSRPNNLRFDDSVRVRALDGDVYNICERVKEIDPNLYIVVADNRETHAFVIMEKCRDGVDRLIFKAAELDDRVLKRLRYLAAKPLSERYETLEREEREWEKQQRDNEMDELYERMGRPMWTQLEHDGFIQRSVSYPKRGVKASRVKGVAGH